MNKKIFVAILTVSRVLISFFCTAGIIKLACWAFNYTFSWKLSIGIWAVMCLIGSVFKSR